MDEMKIKLSTKFMRGIASKIISKVIFKKLGFKTEIQLNEIEAEMKNGKILFHIDVDGFVDEKAFTKIQRIIEEDEES